MAVARHLYAACRRGLRVCKSDHHRFHSGYRAAALAARDAYDVFGWKLVETHLLDSKFAARKLIEHLGGEAIVRELFPDSRERNVFRIPRSRNFGRQRSAARIAEHSSSAVPCPRSRPARRYQ